MYIIIIIVRDINATQKTPLLPVYCDSDNGNAEDIMKRYKELIMVAKTKAIQVTVYVQESVLENQHLAET